jgi:general secretion pathway protein C
MPPPLQTADLGKVLGMQAQGNSAAEKAAPSSASRLNLLGVAKSGSRDMVALIAVDGQAAKPFARGAEVLPGLVLQSVSLQKASLGASLTSPSALQLDMPQRPEAARGSLP